MVGTLSVSLRGQICQLGHDFPKEEDRRAQLADKVFLRASKLGRAERSYQQKNLKNFTLLKKHARGKRDPDFCFFNPWSLGISWGPLTCHYHLHHAHIEVVLQINKMVVVLFTQITISMSADVAEQKSERKQWVVWAHLVFGPRGHWHWSMKCFLEGISAFSDTHTYTA